MKFLFLLLVMGYLTLLTQDVPQQLPSFVQAIADETISPEKIAKTYLYKKKLPYNVKSYNFTILQLNEIRNYFKHSNISFKDITITNIKDTKIDPDLYLVENIYKNNIYIAMYKDNILFNFLYINDEIKSFSTMNKGDYRVFIMLDN